MSFVLSGATTARLLRNSGNISSTGAYTRLIAVKKTSLQTGERQLFTDRKYGGGDDGHDVTINNIAHGTQGISLQANFSAASTPPQDLTPVGTWVWVALVGSGTTLTLSTRQEGETAWQSASVTQATFVPTQLVIGDDGGGTRAINARFAHIREWNAALTLSELSTEIAATFAVRTANLLSAKSGVGNDLGAALMGESGVAFTSGIGVSVDFDEPSFAAAWVGPLLSGQGLFPGTTQGGGGGTGGGVEVTGDARYNRFLQSNDFLTTWSRGSHVVTANVQAATANSPALHRVSGNDTTQGIHQFVSGAPNGVSSASVFAKRDGSNWLAIKHCSSTFGAGTWVFFDLLNGAVGSIFNFGGVTDGSAFINFVGDGVYRCTVLCTINTDRGIEFYPSTGDAVYQPPTGATVLVGGAQYEDGARITLYKPTTTAIATRTLTSVTAGAALTTIGVNETVGLSVTLLDNTGAPWDSFSPVTTATSNAAQATVSQPVGQTDRNGRIAAFITGVSAGSANITATALAITSSAVAMTVGASSTSKFVRVYMEPGWQGTAGWSVGIWANPTSTTFPTGAILYEAPNQKFDDALFQGTQSAMLIPLPSAVGSGLAFGANVVVVFQNASDDSGFRPGVVVSG